MPRLHILDPLKAFAKRHRLSVVAETANGEQQVSVFSDDLTYRYAFARWWSDTDPLWLWVGLNPGTGDAELRRRPTLERCIARSKSGGAGGLLIANLFAARDKTPRSLRTMQDPVGRHNDTALSMLCALAKFTVVAWGGGGSHIRERAEKVSPMLKEAHCLGTTKGGQPRHPLYVSTTEALRPWRPLT